MCLYSIDELKEGMSSDTWCRSYKEGKMPRGDGQEVTGMNNVWLPVYEQRWPGYIILLFSV